MPRRRRAAPEVWDASYFALASAWRVAGHLFPRALRVRSRPVTLSPEVIDAAAASGIEPMALSSALLSCGHLVLVPRELERRPLVPCYKCWAQAGGRIAGITCSFCGVAHEPDVPCMRPHLER
jgi:hypothetical protein